VYPILVVEESHKDENNEFPDRFSIKSDLSSKVDMSRSRSLKSGRSSRFAIGMCPLQISVETFIIGGFVGF
jgi:hypothetical protein